MADARCSWLRHRAIEMRKGGFVYIVGAGPGDPDLITLKGLRAIRWSNVILHDRLVPAELLRKARRDAIVIDVGKRAAFQASGDRPMPNQEGPRWEREARRMKSGCTDRGWPVGPTLEDEQQTAIHTFMIDYARQGMSVCRLKGGDPFVFGRGGEEVQALKGAGIPFEVIPGVSSAFAAPGAAGIPLTHRKHGHAFMVIAGSKSSDLASAEWTSAADLLAAGGSLVVMMGLARLPFITERLMAGGCSEDISAAVISKATWPDERVVLGKLGTIGVGAQPLESPAVVVLGSVVSIGRNCGRFSVGAVYDRAVSLDSGKSARSQTAPTEDGAEVRR